MAQLIYNGINLGGPNGRYLRTVDVQVEPVMDRSGVTKMYEKWTFNVVAVVNPVALATFAKGATVLATGPIVGDSAGLTFQQIHETLTTPRKQLFFDIGPTGLKADNTDHLLAAPMLKTTATSPPTFYDVDAANGPIPGPLKILQVIGDKTLLISWHCVATVSQCSKVVVANRWSVSSQIDELGYTTRTLRGRATLRTDMALDQGVVIDQFRAHFMIAPPNTFRRVKVDVVATEDGREVDYTAIDQQQLLCLGEKGAAVKIEGNYTIGGDVPIRNGGDLWEATKGLSGALFDMAAYGGPLMLFQLPSLVSAVSKYVPTMKANAIIRAYGSRSANRADLAALCLDVFADRFAPIYARIAIISLYITFGIEQNVVELRADILPLGLNVLGAMFTKDFASLVKTAPAIAAPGGALLAGTGGKCPALPFSGGTRGTYVGTLITQMLTNDCALPADTATETRLANQNKSDQNLK